MRNYLVIFTSSLCKRKHTVRATSTPINGRHFFTKAMTMSEARRPRKVIGDNQFSNLDQGVGSDISHVLAIGGVWHLCFHNERGRSRITAWPCRVLWRFLQGEGGGLSLKHDYGISPMRMG